jgi:hypothetical protein
MAYVDENTVAQYLSNHITGLGFRPIEPEDEGVDGEVGVWQLSPEQKLPWSVQCGGGYLGLNETGYPDPSNTATIWVRQHAYYGVQPDDLAQLVEDLKAKL